MHRLLIRLGSFTVSATVPSTLTRRVVSKRLRPTEMLLAGATASMITRCVHNSIDLPMRSESAEPDGWEQPLAT